jgi:hypothetical protein
MGCCTSCLGNGLFIDQIEVLEGTLHCHPGSEQRFEGCIVGEIRMLNKTGADITATLTVGGDLIKQSPPLTMTDYHGSVDDSAVKVVDRRLRVPVRPPQASTIVAAKYTRQLEGANGEQLLSSKFVLHDRTGYELTIQLKPFGSPPNVCSFTLPVRKNDRVGHYATQGSVAIVDAKGPMDVKHVVWTTRGPFSPHNGPSCKFTVRYAKPLAAVASLDSADALEPIRLRSEGNGMPFTDVRVRSCAVLLKTAKYLRFTTSVNVSIYLDTGVISAVATHTTASIPTSGPASSTSEVLGPTEEEVRLPEPAAAGIVTDPATAATATTPNLHTDKEAGVGMGVDSFKRDHVASGTGVGTITHGVPCGDTSSLDAMGISTVGSEPVHGVIPYMSV